MERGSSCVESSRLLVCLRLQPIRVSVCVLRACLSLVWSRAHWSLHERLWIEASDVERLRHISCQTAQMTNPKSTQKRPNPKLPQAALSQLQIAPLSPSNNPSSSHFTRHRPNTETHHRKSLAVIQQRSKHTPSHLSSETAAKKRSGASEKERG
jgi:hypothetical protein